MRHLIVSPDGAVLPPPYLSQRYIVLQTSITMHTDGSGPVMVIEVDPQQQPLNPNIPIYAAQT